MIVADASVVVDLLLGPGSPAGDDLAARLRSRETVCAPHLVDAEAGQVLRRYARRGDLSGRRAGQAVQDLVDLPMRRYPHAPLLPRAFEFWHNVTVYDGLYLSLSEALEAPMHTLDAALVGVPGCRAEVVLLPAEA